MDLTTVLALSVGLAMDCFAVSLGIGASALPCTPRAVARLAWHFGLFQAGMTLLGWLAGSTLVNIIAGFDHWLTFGLLAWVGGKMLKTSLQPEQSILDTGCEDPTRGRSLVMLSIATSIDAASVGLGLAFVNVGIAFSSVLIGLTSLAFSAVGMLAGDRLSRRFGKSMEAVGGVILIIIGLRILLSHLFA